MTDVWTILRDTLTSGEDAVFIRIVGHRGSTPRAAGARMAVTGSGRQFGTIGGGQVDGAAIKGAAQAFETGRSFVVKVAMTAGDAASEGMICGGEVSFLCEYIPADDTNAVRFFENLGKETGIARKQVLCTEFDVSGDTLRPTRRSLVDAEDLDGALPAGLYSPYGVPVRSDTVHGSVLAAAGNRAYCVDVLAVRRPVFIFGAGHVGKEVSDLAINVGFRSIVLDDRVEFANEVRFPPPAEVVLLDAFENGMANLAVDENSYVVIATRGHLHDRVVLSQALRTRAGYIGMIGSKRKRDGIYAALRREGFTDRDIERVHSPIGLPIDTETPEEIAVSIVGELIDCRAKQK